jgi:hypothetical protein
MAEPPPLTNETATSWFTEALPNDWFTDLRALVDRDEIMVIGSLQPTAGPSGEGAPDHIEPDPTELAHIQKFREATRDARVSIAQRAEQTLGRKVAWAATCGSSHVIFTHLSVPVMTRLRMPERQILDTLVGAGVARSRSDALGWCVRRVAQHQHDWLAELSEAISAVSEIRTRGPA